MTTGDDDDDGDIEGVGDVVTCSSPVSLVPLSTRIALEVVVSCARWVLTSPPPPSFLWYCASHLRAVSLARCLRGSGGGRRRHESRRQDSRRRPVVVAVWSRRALWCILDLNKKDAYCPRSSPCRSLMIFIQHATWRCAAGHSVTESRRGRTTRQAKGRGVGRWEEAKRQGAVLV